MINLFGLDKGYGFLENLIELKEINLGIRAGREHLMLHINH